ncbi:MAG: phosphopantothenoylcysteine decarboxylase, partial [Nitrosotalea sp.]
PTIEHIDPVRVITNQSTGKTGVLLASEFVSAGCQVTLIYGPGTEIPPKGAKVIRVQTSTEMSNSLRKEMGQKHDIVILAAAASDYTLEKPYKTKLNSDLSRISLKLKRVPKMINDVKKIQRDIFLVGFKAETNVSKKDLIRKAREKITQSSCDLVIANDIGTKRYKKNPDYNNVISVDLKTFKESGWKTKTKVVKFIRNEIEKRID